MNAEQNVADEEAMRRSHASANENPPPYAAPFTAPITICGVARMCWVRFDMNACPVRPAG